jgi:hypothetical protein
MGNENLDSLLLQALRVSRIKKLPVIFSPSPCQFKRHIFAGY